MKLLCFAISTFIIGFAFLSQIQSRRLVGTSACTWGPSYWCGNITNAKNCNAVRHCIQTVWEKQTVKEDNDSICKVCLDMVKQARDQLQSNETENDIKAVFDGSCHLIPIKPIQKECIKLVDEFAPELIEALASQMNPQVVCSVAGLCNNAKIDKMLEDIAAKKQLAEEQTAKKTISSGNNLLSCDDCSKIGSKIAEKFHTTSRDDILEHMLRTCGMFSSFSDACSSIIITNFDTIYSCLQNEISSKNICHLSGVCAVTFYHQHEKPSADTIDIRPMSSVGVVPHTKLQDDDMTCELCEQLVRHLRDVLVANTTESEFKQVLEGLCKQTKGFKDECLSIVDQYYEIIYNTLVHNLDPNGACFMAGICKKGSQFSGVSNRPIQPLLPASVLSKYQGMTKTEPKRNLLGKNEPKFSAKEIQSMQLPIDKLMGPPNAAALVENGELCTICEYFLHFVQEALATPQNEDKIKEIIAQTCDKIPKAIQGSCHNFVNLYGDAVIALLIQDIDPSQICPKLKLCPQNVRDMEVLFPKVIEINQNHESDKPTCPLCLFAVAQAQAMIKNDKTEKHVQDVLDNLCNHINGKLKEECVNFVNTYSSQLIEKLVNGFTPQQICEYLKLCQEPTNDLNIHVIDSSEHEILTNEIIDRTINGIPVVKEKKVGDVVCTVCKKIVERTENKLMNMNKTKENIIDVLEESCELIHELKPKCRKYIDKYGEDIAKYILQELGPSEICHRIQLCSSFAPEINENLDNLNVEIVAVPVEKETKKEHSKELNNGVEGQECVLCEFIMQRLELELKNKKTQDEIKSTVHNICKRMPTTISHNCDSFIDKYADLIIALVDTMPPKEICTRINLCQSKQFHIDANEEITECGVCHGAVLSVYSLIKENPEAEFNGNDMVFEACNEIPAKYYGKCSDLIAYYGESIYNLLKRNTDLSAVCQTIGKCFVTEKPLQSYFKIGGALNLRKKRESNKIVGAKKCTWGPSYWCENIKQADECNSKSWCIEKKVGFGAV